MLDHQLISLALDGKNYKSNNRNCLAGEDCMQQHIFEHFKSGFLILVF